MSDRWKACLASLGLAFVAIGCGPSGGSVEAPRSSVRVGGDVVAIVDGEPIRVSEVRAEMRRGGGSSREALDRVEARILLFHEAARRGLGRGASARFMERRALVQRLLRDVEQEVLPSSIPDDEVRRTFEQFHARWDRPERRTFVHLLVRTVPGAGEGADEAAEALAQSVLESVRGEADPVEALRRRSTVPSPDPRLELRFEETPPFERSAPLEPAFRDAVFAPTSPGLLPQLVHTGVGYHVVALAAIEPAVTATLETHAETVREELLDNRRFRAVDRLVQDSKQRHGIELREATIRRLLGDDALFEQVH